MTWTDWTFEEWNKALVSAVFLDTRRGTARISRIDVTDRFWAKCTGDSLCNPSAARRKFIASFGSTERQVLDQFVWSNKIEVTTKCFGFPQIFSQLYLTLLAASADESTYDEGNFRNRFAALVKPVEIRSNFSFRDLPLLWSHVSKWSSRRAKELGDCRVLELPNPEHERIIGHSKRLAFPTYRDELQLRRLLEEFHLTSDSEFISVSRAAYSRLASFSPIFAEELKQFSKLAAAAEFDLAHGTPFWGAVRDISWEIASTEALKTGSYCLGVEVSDPYAPEVYLLADEVGKNRLSKFANFSPMPSGDGFGFVVTQFEEGRWTPQKLASLSLRIGSFAKSRVGKALTCGCVVLFPDKFGNLTTEGEYFEECQVCLLLREQLFSSIERHAKHYGLKVAYLGTEGTFSLWKGLLFKSLDREALKRLAAALPEASRAGMGLTWKPPRPRLSGGAWYGQALLLSPASNPLVSMAGAVAGAYELLDSDNNQLSSGDMEAVDSGFHIPPKALVGQDSISKVRFTLLESVDSLEDSVTVPVMTDLPLSAPIPLRDQNAWLVDGRAGVLSPYSDLMAPVGFTTVTPQFAPKFIHALVEPLFERVDRVSSSPCQLDALDDLQDIFDWICEAVSLRFQRRATLPYAELNSHISSAAEATGVEKWAPLKLLIAAGWIARLEMRSAPHTVFAPSVRSISVHREGERPIARIVGMLSRSERSNLRASLIDGETIHRLQGNGSALTIGAIEVQLAHCSRVAEIAARFGMTVLTRDSFGSPVVEPRGIPPSIETVGKELPQNGGLQAWNPVSRTWFEFSPGHHPVPAGMIIRYPGSQRYTHWVFGDGVHWKTDSANWAWLLQIVAMKEPVGYIAENGECRFSERLMGILPSLCRWWMHWGGGCVSLDPAGCLLFSGGCDFKIWEQLTGWIGSTGETKFEMDSSDIALGRRKLALRRRWVR